MTITIHENVEQGSDEWFAMRCGILTASEMKLIVTPTLKMASNEKERQHLYELLAQRITGHVEPSYVSDDMLRGREDEVEARIAYGARYAPVQEVGFVTNNRFGFDIGFSPDGLVGGDGFIEAKGRRQKYQIEAIVAYMPAGKIPDDFLIQVQTGLLVTERKWCDFITYSGGLPMATIRVLPDLTVQAAIIKAATEFEARIQAARKVYDEMVGNPTSRLIPTERRIEQEII